MPRLRRTATAFAAAALAVLASVTAGCGAADDVRQAVDPVADAAVATQHAGTAEITLRASIGGGGVEVPLSGAGVISTTGPRARLHFGTGSGAQVDEVVDGHVLYLHGDAITGALGGDRPWVRLDLGRLLRHEGFDPSQLNGVGAAAGDLLRYLRGAGDVHTLGRAQVFGVPATRYRAGVDVDKLVRAAGVGASAAALRRLRAQLAGPMTLELWVDDHHRVRREVVDYGLSVAGHLVRLRFDLALRRFGVPLRLGLPPAAQTRDVTPRLERALSARARAAPGP